MKRQPEPEKTNLNPISMKTKLLAILLVLFGGVFAHAQIAKPAVSRIKGKFYVCVDDGAKIFHNGMLVHTAPVNFSMSSEVEIAPGDRVVAQLNNDGGRRRFRMAFVSNDSLTAVNFLRQDYRLISDLAQVDFTEGDWAKWQKRAKEGEKEQTKGPDGFPFKSSADWVWGEADVCSLGAIVSANMIKATSTSLGGPAAINAMPIVLTVEAFVDGPSTLYVRKDGVMWVNGGNAKPGLNREPTYVNGQRWMPKWAAAAQERGPDRSDLFPLMLQSLDLQVSLVSNMKERGMEQIDPSRKQIEIRKRQIDFEIVIPDPEPGQRWYKVVFRSRKKL